MRGLYIHIPFCAAKCRYCAFTSVAAAPQELMQQMTEAILRDIASLPNRTYDTIYIGGGTPSLLPVPLLSQLLDGIQRSVTYLGTEWTIEVNPESVTDELADTISRYPISRISMGVQSCDDAVLKLLGRIHTAERAAQAYRTLRSRTECQINLDLIFDIPSVPAESIYRSLESLIAMQPEHISAYSYSCDTGFLPDLTDSPEQYQYVEKRLAEAGYLKYEISNFARTGCESRHNIIYWTMEPYDGAGPAAHSMDYDGTTRIRRSKTTDIHAYLSHPEGFVSEERIAGDMLTAESVTFGLRMKKGVDTGEIEKKFGKLPPELVQKMKILETRGLLTWHNGRLQTTENGELLLDSVMEFLLPD